MAASALQRSASSAVQRAPSCVVCVQAIVQQYNRFRCTEAGGEKLTKLGCILEDVTDKANIHLKISMHTVSHMCRRCREFILRIDKTYQNFLSMQKKLQDLLKPRLTTGDFEKTSICSKSPDREQQHLKITEYEMSKRTLTPVRDNEPKSKKPMRLLLPKPAKRSLPSPQTRTGVSPATKRTTIRSRAHENENENPPACRIDPDSEPNVRVPSTGLCPTALPFHQEEVTIKVYEDIKDDEEESIKVVLVNNPCTYRILPSNLTSIGLSLLNRTSLINTILADTNLREKVLAAIIGDLMQECDHLCGKKSMVSILRKSKPDDLLQFSWEELQSEWKREAPTLYRVLEAVATPRLADKLSEDRLPAMCVAGSILLRSRNQHMSAIQQLIGLILFHGNVRKQTHNRLNHLLITVSPTATLNKMEEFGSKYDKKVQEWVKMLSDKLEAQKDGSADPVTPTVQFIGDNVDLRQYVSHETIDRKGQDHHWFHLMAVKDRVVPDDLSKEHPQVDIRKLPLQTFLPSVQDCHDLHTEITVLVSRVLVAHLTAFKFFNDLIPQHITHKYSAAMEKKSEIVPMGVLTKSEQSTEGMIDIMLHTQSYVPQSSDGQLLLLFFGGDQLTRERAYHAQDAKLQSKDPKSRLVGLVPKVEDWHTRVTFYQVIFNRLFTKNSIGDKGTLKQIQVLINRQNIPTKVKDNPNAVEDFIDVVVDAHVVAAALTFFGMESAESTPTKNINIAAIKSLPLKERQSRLLHAVSNLVSKYVMHHVLTDMATSTAVSAEGQDSVPSIPEETTSDLIIMGEDYKLNYATAVLGMGMLARNFHDASREGDGERLIRCWKFFMLHFKVDGRVKYAVEAINILAQVNGLLPPAMGHQLIWNRTCNLTGGAGKNIPLDLQMEHLNRVFKENINTFRSKISEKSISRSSQAIGPIQQLINTFDKVNKLKKPASTHVIPSVKKDFEIILQTLKTEKVFTHVKGRYHESFKTFNADPFAKLKADPKKLHAWIRSKVNLLATDHKLRKQK